IYARGVVTRRKLVASRSSRRRVVLAPGTAGELQLACLRRAHERKTNLAIGSGDLLRLRRQRRGSPLWRGNDRRRTPAGALHGPKHVIVGAGDIGLAPARGPLIAAGLLRPQSVEFRPLGVGKEFLVRKPRGALQRRVIFDGPDSLQIGLAPGRL